MFMGINVCIFMIFETKLCLLGLIFMVNSHHGNFLGILIMFVGICYCDKNCRKIRQTNALQMLMNLQYVICYL